MVRCLVRTFTLIVAAIVGLGSGHSHAEPLQDTKNWSMQTGNAANHRYSTLDQINATNVGSLKVAWGFSTGVLGGHEGAPLVIGDVMYIHTPFPNNVYALDLNNNAQILWSYEPKQDRKLLFDVMCCDMVNRGLAYGDGKIFLYQANTTLVALDIKTGKVQWTFVNGDPKKGETGTSAPMVIKNKVFVGISGGEFGVRGHITALSIKDGSLIWRGYSTGPDTETLIDPEKTTHLGKPVGKDSGLTTWNKDQWKFGGGTTWGWYSYDPELNLIYYGTGNPAPWNPEQRPGDNRWTNTIFARDIDSGVAKWLYQITPHDEWSYDGVNEMILANIKVKGKNRRALVHFDRNGFGYTLDRATGELLVAEKFDPTVNWATHVDLTTGRPQVDPKYSIERAKEEDLTVDISPTTMGTKNQQPASFSPKTGLFYVPTTVLYMNFERSRVSYKAGAPFIGAQIHIYPQKLRASHIGGAIAWNADKGVIAWSKKERYPVWSGLLVTAGDVVFYGTMEGDFKAVSAKDGKELFKARTPSGIIGNVFTYEHKGKQFVGVLSGIGGFAGLALSNDLWNPSEGLVMGNYFAGLNRFTRKGGSLTVFSLP